ncbi:MAG: hypothetical protein Q8R11_01560, partial [bacterium]|nr:hypothetical protein [bacterium]
AMVTLFHGDDEEASRLELQRLIDTWEGDVVRAPQEPTQEDLVNLFQTSDLFGRKRLVIFEQSAFEILEKLPPELAESTTIIFWESRFLPPTVLRKLPKHIEIRAFKLKKIIFTWLDNLRPGKFRENVTMLHQLLRENEQPERLFPQLTSRLLQLLAAKTQQELALQDWQERKLRTQAQGFSTGGLVHLLARCRRIDRDQKTGRAAYPLTTHLELLLAAIDRSGEVG